MIIVTCSIIYSFPGRHEYRLRGNDRKVVNKDYSIDSSLFAKADLPKHDPCEVIHIGTVCSGHNSNLYFLTLLKSLYFYRVNPIHFHILTNKNSKHILETLFDTWNVPQGKFFMPNYICTDFLEEINP